MFAPIYVVCHVFKIDVSVVRWMWFMCELVYVDIVEFLAHVLCFVIVRFAGLFWLERVAMVCMLYGAVFME